MNVRVLTISPEPKHLIAGLSGSIALLLCFMIFIMVSVAGAPYEIAQPGGMRAMDDPVLMLFCLYSFLPSMCLGNSF